jgi:hypothetical protein
MLLFTSAVLKKLESSTGAIATVNVSNSVEQLRMNTLATNAKSSVMSIMLVLLLLGWTLYSYEWNTHSRYRLLLEIASSKSKKASYETC